jgi:hypothetical protein
MSIDLSIETNSTTKRPLKYVYVDCTCVCCRSLKPAQLFESGVPSVLKGVRVRVRVRVRIRIRIRVWFEVRISRKLS